MQRCPASPGSIFPACRSTSSSGATIDKPCFFQDIDRIRALQDLRVVAIAERRGIHAYVLMTNHVDLLVTPTLRGQVARLMQSLGRRYVRYINARYHRAGTLWQGRVRRPQ